jgi:hypothetical protein
MRWWRHSKKQIRQIAADNLGLASNGALRAVLNSGHRRGGKVTRYHGGQALSFSTFAPLAVGRSVPIQVSLEGEWRLGFLCNP